MKTKRTLWNAMDFQCLWWQRDNACRFGNKEEIGNGIFHCTENVSHGEGLCMPVFWL